MSPPDATFQLEMQNNAFAAQAFFPHSVGGLMAFLKTPKAA